MRRESAQQAPLAARDRILQAARRRFSRHAYEDIGLWDIAADAGVDVACMYRCFGSKEELFARAVGTALRPDRIPQGSTASLHRWPGMSSRRTSGRPTAQPARSMSSPARCRAPMARACCASAW